MAEKIIQANILEQSKRDLTTYAIYVARRRALPNPFDGLKPVHRNILYSMILVNKLVVEKQLKLKQL